MTAPIDLLSRHGSKVIFSSGGGPEPYRLFLAKSRANVELLPTLYRSDCITPVFSPDGSGALFSEHDGSRFALCHIDLSTGDVTRLTSSVDNDYCPCWAPDGSAIAWCRAPAMDLQNANQAEIYISPWPGFEERRLTCNDRMDAYPVFSSNGRSVIVESGDVASMFGLFEVAVDNGAADTYEVCVIGDNANRIATVTEWSLPRFNPTPRFSHDGLSIACHQMYRKGVCRLAVLSADSEPEKYLGDDGGNYKLPRWSADDKLVAAQDHRRKEVAVFNMEGLRMRLEAPGEYRLQRFMEIYNFDIF